MPVSIKGPSAESNLKEHARQARRDQLIDATLSAITRYGLSSTTVSRVAELASLSPGIVSFYFTSKDSMLLETLKSLALEFDGAMNEALSAHEGNPVACLLRIIELRFDPSIADPRKIAVWSAFWGESQARSEYQQLCGASDRAYSTALIALCGDIVASGEYGDLHAEDIALAFDGLMEGLLQDLLVDSGNVNLEQAKRTCLAYLASVFPRHFTVTEASVTAVVQSAAPLLATWTYFNEEFLDLEVENLFQHNWQLVGHVNEVPASGDFLTFDLRGDRALIIRGDDHQVRAFHNVCRHRGSRVVATAHGRCSQRIVCPFHGWTYDLRGNLKGIPQAATFTGVDLGKEGLVPLAVEIWHGLIFIRFGGNPPAVGEMMAPLEEELAPYRIDDMVPFGKPVSVVVPVNWKVLHDVDNEGYHVPIGHPGLNSLLCDYHDTDYPHHIGVSRASLASHPSKHWSIARYQSLLPAFPHLPQDKQRVWLYWGMFPNLSLALYPDMLEYFHTIPLGADSTLLTSRYFALPDERGEVCAARYLNMRINRQVGAEDLKLAQWNYEGMRSSVFPRNRLSSLESGVAKFHKVIRTSIPVAGLDCAPAAGSVDERNRSMLASAR